MQIWEWKFTFLVIFLLQVAAPTGPIAALLVVAVAFIIQFTGPSVGIVPKPLTDGSIIFFVLHLNFSLTLGLLHFSLCYISNYSSSRRSEL